MSESFYLSGKEWLVPVAIALVVAMAFVWWAYHKAPTDGKTRFTCISLKIIGIVLLLLCLIDPMTTKERASPGANLLALVADTSEGLNLTDAGASQSRAANLQAALETKKESWQTKLAKDFELKRYRFDTRLANLTDFNDLTFEGSASRLGESIRTLARRFQGQPLAGILVFTDGVATDLETGLPDLSGLPPVYPVVIGKGSPERDLAVDKVTVTQTVFEDAPVTILGHVEAHGYEGEKVTAKLELLDANGTPATQPQELALTAGEPDAKLTFRFQVRPASSGILFYRFTTSASDETEATSANNTRVVVVDRGKGPYRVLYVAGRANWEFKFLKRALEEDEEIALVGLVRIAKKEPKFTFKGRSGESSNPLFRGFKNEDQDTEEYDKPVLIRLNTRDADELKTGFPATAEELFAYSAVIIDDLEAAFFTSSQHALIQEFVNQRGGGLLMLGGQESFRQGKYERTPIGDMLPVYLDRQGKSTALDDLRLDLTRDGWLQPWMRLRDNEAEEKERLGQMAAFSSLNQVRGNKPGASVMASVQIKGKGSPYPALVTHKFGHGRVAAMLLGDVWRWGLSKPEHHDDMDQAWRQMIRWLIADVPASIEFTAGQATDTTGKSLLVTALDKAFQPLDNAEITLKVRTVGSPETIPLTAEADEEKAGVYSTQFIPRATGGYLAEAEVRDSAGKVMGRRQAGWTTDFAAAEYRSLSPNRPLLDDLANKTGGRVLRLDELDGFAEILPTLRVPVTETVHFPIWHQTPFFLLALACFVAEWFLRRRKGLP